MSNIYQLPMSAQVYDEASVWIAKLDNGLSLEEEDSLRHWLSASRHNQELLFKMAGLWDRLSVLSRLSEICPHPHIQVVRFPWLKYAACLLIILVAGIWGADTFYHREAPDSRESAAILVPENVYETAVGEQSRINLVDGTQLVLNTNTFVQINYSDQHRLLTLERGELHIIVAPDKSRPLSVIAGDTIIQAVGTTFNIEITSNHQIELLVTEGKVRVGVFNIPPTGVAQAVPFMLPPDSMTVSAGEETILGLPVFELETIETDEIEVKLSWREGNLIFRGETLEEAVAEISRYTAVEFVILDEKSKKVRVAGLFKAGDVNGLLAALEENFDVTYERVGDKKILLKGR